VQSSGLRPAAEPVACHTLDEQRDGFADRDLIEPLEDRLDDGGDLLEGAPPVETATKGTESHCRILVPARAEAGIV
jgi:hypothetical protein